VKELVTTLIDDGQHVLMIMHSYGGAVGSSAVESLSLSERKASGKSGGVIHLLYLCAYILPTGYSVWNIVQEAKFEKVLDGYMDTTTDGLTMPKEPGFAFFSGRADQATIDKALETLVWFPSRTLKDPTTGSAWRTIPTTYIRTLQDFGVPAVYQDIMLAKVQEAGVVVKTEVYDADHSIFITMEREMVQAAINAASDGRNTV
jgi:pimeloyl-ACP methyl ester carboxylesterase